jgi:hypothetical protein
LQAILLETRGEGVLRTIRNAAENTPRYHGPSFTGETMKKMLKIALIAAAAAAAFGASAQEFPAKDKSVTIIVPFAAGGPTDRVARDLAEALRKPLGTTVVVDNTAGAGSSIGSARVARAAPDGYTLLLNHIGMSTMPALYRKLAFSVPNDFEYLGIVNDVPMTLIARPSMPANNYKELTAWIQQNKGKINLGNAGLGAASHLCGLMFKSALQTEMTDVPYKGTAPRPSCFLMKSGSFRATLRASLIFLVTSGGVPLGAYRPCQMVTLKSFTPDSARVGRSLRAGVVRRLVVVTA